MPGAVAVVVVASDAVPGAVAFAAVGGVVAAAALAVVGAVAVVLGLILVGWRRELVGVLLVVCRSLHSQVRFCTNCQNTYDRRRTGSWFMRERMDTRTDWNPWLERPFEILAFGGYSKEQIESGRTLFSRFSTPCPQNRQTYSPRSIYLPLPLSTGPTLGRCAYIWIEPRSAHIRSQCNDTTINQITLTRYTAVPWTDNLANKYSFHNVDK